MNTTKNAMTSMANEGVTMRSANLLLVLTALAAAACNIGRDEIDQVQTNIVDKAIFEGDWFYQETLIKLTGDNALFTGEFVGDNLNYDFGVLKGEMGIPGTYPATENRIRWVIDKDVLLAFRADELVVGGNVNAGNDRWPLRPGTKVRQALPDDSGVSVGTNGTVVASTPVDATVEWEGGSQGLVTKAAFAGGAVLADLSGFEFLGEPLAAFPVTEHLDIRYGYNPTTGEKSNIRTENTSDRRWYERRYMRVDWSTNIVSRVINFDGFSDEPAGVLAEEGTVWPERWQPQFVSPKDDPTAPYANEFRQDEVYYMSFVTRRVRSPGINCLFGWGPCSSMVYTVRSSFLKSSPNHEYVGLQEPGHMYDRFGVIRLGIPTYTRGGEDDPEDGITQDRGETDFVNYWALRHNMWNRHLDASGQRLSDAELWAPENIRGIRYMMSDRYPAYLMRPGMQVFVEWNKPFANMIRRYNGEATPEEGGEPIDCAITGGVDGDEYADGAALDGNYPDNYEAFDGDRTLKMEGSECWVTVQINPCDVDPANACVELGDIRYHFFNLIPDPGPWFCGVSIPTADGRSGELISANINTTTQCLDNATTGFLDYLHVIRDGVMDNEDIISGEYVREYLANNGWVRYPVTPGPEGPLYNANNDGGNGLPRGASFGDPQSGMPANIDLAMAVRDRLEHFRDYNALTPEFRAQMYSDARRSLEGSALEQTLLDAMGQHGVALARAANPRLDIPEDADIRDDVVADRVSPFRNGGYLTLLRQADPAFNPALNRPGRIYEPDLADMAFQDPNIASVINLIPAGWTDAQIGVWFRRRILLWVMLHELGHSLGMEHNFAGSIDRNNYLDAWYPIDGQNPLPKSEDYGLDSAPTAEDLRQYAEDTRAARDARDNAGIALHQYTSVMDYMGLAERMTPKLGKYDHAVVSWSYGNQVELYDGDPRTGSDDFTLDPTTVGRTWISHYIGGETCESNADCPASDQAGISQRCLQNPRYERQPALCKPQEGDVGCVCSSYEEDVKEASLYGYDCDGNGTIGGTGEFNWDCDGDGATDHWPVDYMTCSNDRLSDISWCNQFDRGSTFREVVQNMRDSYNRYYPWRNFRRHRPGFGQFSAANSVAASMYDAVKIYQHLLYRYFYEEDFAARTGALGFWDEMLASVDTMNWMNSILAQPDVGSYDFGEDEVLPDGKVVPILHRVGDLADGAGQFDLNMGPGKWVWSLHQGDEYGVFDFERAGTFFEKMLAYEALARREWGLGYTYDERFYVNFYDFFSTSMEQIYGGALRGDVALTGGYYDATDNTITFPEAWTGIGDFNGRPEYCIMPTDRIPDGLPAVADHLPLLLRQISAAWALSEFAVFYDTAFAQKMYIFVEGSGEGVRIPEFDPRDGQPLVEGLDYIRYTSETRGKTYVSMQVEPQVRFPGCSGLVYDDGDPGTEDPSVYGSISFSLLEDAVEAQARLQALRADPGADPAEVERVRLDVANRDSLIELLIDMQRRFGISNYFL